MSDNKRYTTIEVRDRTSRVIKEVLGVNEYITREADILKDFGNASRRLRENIKHCRGSMVTSMRIGLEDEFNITIGLNTFSNKFYHRLSATPPLIGETLIRVCRLDTIVDVVQGQLDLRR